MKAITIEGLTQQISDSLIGIDKERLKNVKVNPITLQDMINISRGVEVIHPQLGKLKLI